VSQLGVGSGVGVVALLARSSREMVVGQTLNCSAMVVSLSGGRPTAHRPQS
jgi:hypothetical protein